MNDQWRRQQLLALLAADAQGTPGSRISVICARCVVELGVSGTGATVLSRHDNGGGCGRNRGLVHATNQASAGLEGLQFILGEGPCLDAFESGGPILAGDLASETARWPAFAREALDLGAAAVFSFPLQIGVVRLGSLDCYRDTPGPLSVPQLSDALILTNLAALAVVAELDGHDTGDVGWLADAHTEVYQATGMIKVQLDTSSEAALLRLRGYAYTHHLSLNEVATQVVARRLHFTPDQP